LDIVVADAASLVGKRLKVRIERVLDGRAYALPIRKTKEAPEPLTAEGEAEKPTRKPPARKGAVVAKESELPVDEPEDAGSADADADAEVLDEPGGTSEASPATPAAKRKTRRGSRGGRKRKKPQTAEAPAAEGTAEPAAEETAEEPARAVTIHVPGDNLGRPEAVEEAPTEPKTADEPATAEAEETPKPKKKTRRGSRGGKNRKKKPASAATNGSEATAESEATPEAAEPSSDGEFEYVPMSEWVDELERKG
ncbi:MAG: hypothetical protein ACRDL7_03660, partial [Gaiellaceae bacterium]